MPTSSAAVASAKSGVAVAGSAGENLLTVAASSAAHESRAAPADFVAMLGQMLQGPPAAAGELAIEALDSGSDDEADSTVAADGEMGLLDPAGLADQLLAMAAFSTAVPVPVTTTNTSAAAYAAVPAPAEPVITLGADGALGDATASGEGDHKARSQTDAAGASGFGTLQSSTSQVAAASGQINTQVITQVSLPAFASNDMPVQETTQRSVHSSVGSSSWANELGARLTLMAGQGQHSASLRLSPEHLGPLEVRIDLSDDKASVWFGAQHADTRVALNEALPRLRELFAASGMMLTDAGVSQQQSPPRQESRDSAARLAQDLDSETQPSPIGATASVTSVTNPRLLDLYA